MPEKTQKILQKIKQIIREIAPEAVETISYGIPTFDLNDRHLVHFAAYKKHIGFYPTPSAIEAFNQEFSQYKWKKGSVQFPLEKSIPYDLIRRIVIFRLREVQQGNLKLHFSHKS